MNRSDPPISGEDEGGAKPETPTASAFVPVGALARTGEKKPWKERLSACNGCDLCGDRCIAGYSISYREFRRIQEYLERQDPAERERIAAQEKRLPWPGVPEETYEACRFRDVERGQCGIYPVRPLVCRLFGHVEWLPCPAGIIPETAPEGRKMMERYFRRDLKPYEEWLSLEEGEPPSRNRGEPPSGEETEAPVEG